MAFSKTPTVDTYSSQEIELIHDLELLPSSGTGNHSTGLRDRLLSGVTNVLPFKDEKDKLYGETRYALRADTVVAGNNTICRGFHVWFHSQGPSTTIGVEDYEIVVIDDNASSRAYWRLNGTGAWNLLINLTVKAQTPVRFAEYIDATNVKKLCMVDGEDLYIITEAANVLAAARCLDVDLPKPHVPFPVFLNGYLFLAKQGTGDIYNSDLNNPNSWTPGNFISAEMYPDDIQALVRVNNYILAIGQTASEYFYDAGNATGSPLARQESAALPFGTVVPNSVAYNRNTVMMLTNSRDGDFGFKVIEGFKYADFPGKAVLETYSTQVSLGTTTFDHCRAGFVRQAGELFYFFVFDGQLADNTWATVDTVMASLSTKIWIRTTCDLYNSGTASGASGFPVMYACPGKAGDHHARVAGQISVTGGAFVGKLTPDEKTDALDAFNLYNIFQQFVIPPQRFGTWNYKNMHRMVFDYYVIPSLDGFDGTPGAKLRYSDDLTQNWTTAFPLGKLINDFPIILQLGRFRQRMFEVSAFGTRMMWNKLEVNINKGQV